MDSAKDTFRAPEVGRIAFYNLMGWVWTGQHRDLGDREMTRAVMLSRALSLAFPASVALLLLLGRFQ